MLASPVSANRNFAQVSSNSCDNAVFMFWFRNKSDWLVYRSLWFLFCSLCSEVSRWLDMVSASHTPAAHLITRAFPLVVVVFVSVPRVKAAPVGSTAPPPEPSDTVSASWATCWARSPEQPSKPPFNLSSPLGVNLQEPFLSKTSRFVAHLPAVSLVNHMTIRSHTRR